MTIIRGDTGWIVVDPLLSEETAAAGWKLFADTVEAKSGTRPIRAVIFSHSHSDHFGGVGGIVNAEQVAKEKTASSPRTVFRKKRRRKMSWPAARWGGARSICSAGSWRRGRTARSTPRA